jgi:hypothetical protein
VVARKVWKMMKAEVGKHYDKHNKQIEITDLESPASNRTMM